MIAAFFAVLHLIPGFTSLAQFVVGKVYDSKVAMYQARWGVTRDVAVAAIQAQAPLAQAQVSWIEALAKNPIMMGLVVGFALPWIILEWKALVYDNVWQFWGTYHTDPVKGALADWGDTILKGIFITGGGLGIAHAVINKKD